MRIEKRMKGEKKRHRGRWPTQERRKMLQQSRYRYTVQQEGAAELPTKKRCTFFF